VTSPNRYGNAYLQTVSGFWVQGHAPVLPAPPVNAGREGTRRRRGPKDGGQPAGGGPAPQAPGPASPAGQAATRTQLGREASGLGRQAPTFAHVAASGRGGRTEVAEASWANASELGGRSGEGLRTKRWGAGEVGPPVACLPARLRVCTRRDGWRRVGSRGRLRVRGNPHAGRCRGG
jgi:hypothetical protein